MKDMHVNEPLLKQIIKQQASQSGKVSDVDNKLSDLEKGVTRILSYLENDDAMGTKGIVHQQKDMSKRISHIENQMENQEIRVKTQIRLAGGIAGALATIGGLVAKYLF